MLRTCKSSMQTSAWFLLTVVVVLCRKSLRACLLPVVAEVDLAAHAALQARQALLMFLEAVKRCDEAFVAQGGEPGDVDIDADGARRRWQWLFDFALRLNRREPLAARLAHGDIAHLTQHVAAVAVT